MKKKYVFNHLKIILYIISAFLISPSILIAQSNVEDVVYLKDGSVLRGSIVTFNENKSLKIEIEGGNQFFVLLDEVLEIKKEPRYRGRYFKERGYVNYTGIDRLPGGSGNSTRFQMINGYQFNPHLSLGLGVAYVNYNDPLNLVPVFADIKVNFLKANTTPFTFLKLGYSFTSDNKNVNQIEVENHKGGLMFNIGGGLIFETKAGYGWYFNVGYNLERLSYEENNGWWNQQSVETELTYKRANFGFGLTF